MNINATITLLDICLKQCFTKFSFHFDGVLLAVRGCSFMFRGCSRTLKIPNSPPLMHIIVRATTHKDAVVAHSSQSTWAALNLSLMIKAGLVTPMRPGI